MITYQKLRDIPGAFGELKFVDQLEANEYIAKMERTNSLKFVQSFTTDISCALKFADVTTRSPNLLSLQLTRMGQERAKPSVGLVLAC